MRSRVLLTALAAFLTWTGPGLAGAATPDQPAADQPVREIFVPFEDLGALLENQPQRVLLSRAEYEDLLRKARRSPAEQRPYAVVPVSAAYSAVIGQERAELTGTLAIEVLAPGLQTVDLDLADVGLRRALLDGKGAAIGRNEHGGLRLFIDGPGRHELVLDMVAPVETTAALQTLNFAAPVTAATRLRLRVPGNVEVKSGASVVSRAFDEAAQATEFELLPQRGRVSLVMTLNNRLLQTQRVVLARSVIVDELTASYERLHATFSMAILHRPVDSFRFALPDGFELTDVKCAQLAHWTVVRSPTSQSSSTSQPDAGGSQRVVEVQLRQPTTENVVIMLSAVRTPARLEEWALPDLKALDVAGDVAVVGVLLEERLKVQTLRSARLIPIDTNVLTTALPATVFEAEPGAPALRPVAAYYAPTGIESRAVQARFERPPGRLLVTTNLWLMLGEQDLQVRGGVTLRPEVEPLFTVEIAVPPDWHVLGVSDNAGQALAFEPLGGEGDKAGSAGVRVRLPTGIPAGQEQSIYVHAVYVPAGWLSEWTTSSAVFPVLSVRGAARDVGAIAVQPGEDLRVYPDKLDGLTPLDEKEAARNGLPDISKSRALAYRYDAPPYSATFRVERVAPRVTARSYSFLRLAPDVLTAHYEIVYQVQEARAKRLSLLLPVTTPADVTVTALDSALNRVQLKEYESAVVGDMRRWTALLADSQRGDVRLLVDFEQRLGDAETRNAETRGVETRDVDLPIVRADGVAYQSGVVAVEGHAELGVEITTHPRKVDVGELAPAKYQPSPNAMGGLETFGFVGDQPDLKARITRRAGYAIPPAIVQRAELTTLVSASGVSQTAARLLLRTKAAFLEIELPPGAQLWSAEIDGQPVEPQRAGQHLLVGLSGGEAGALRDLRIVYDTAVSAVGFWGSVEVPALRLLLPAEGPQGAAVEVPLADLQWNLSLPSGFRIVSHGGTVATAEIERPEPAAWAVARTLYELAGGVNLFYGGLMPSVSLARKEAAYATRMRGVGQEMTIYSNDNAEWSTGTLYGLGVGSAPRDVAGLVRPPAAPPWGPGGPPVLAGVPVLGAGRPAQPQEASKRAAGKPVTEDQREIITTIGETGDKGAAEKAPSSRYFWSLEGVRSLKIDLEQSAEAVTFQSLGGQPRLSVTLANWRRVDALAWALALLVFLYGVVLTRRPARTRAGYVVAVILAATLLPLIAGAELAHVTNRAFYAACLLVPLYLLIAAVKWLIPRAGPLLSRPLSWPRKAKAATTAVVVLACAYGAQSARGDTKQSAKDSITVQIVEPPAPITVPDDAIVIPYDPQAAGSTRPWTLADRLLVPYSKFVELWNLAYPDKPLTAVPPPATYALAGAAYKATLADDNDLAIEGRIDLDLFVDDYVAVPIRLHGGALASALLDGHPARLGVSPTPVVRSSTSHLPPSPIPQPQPASRPAVADGATLLLQVKGKGRHRLDLSVRMQLTRRGGWRAVSGTLPAAPATALDLQAPQPGTEIRLGGLSDRRSYETAAAGEVIATALGADGALEVQWRPRVQEGRVESSLTATSAALVDVREDGLRLIWKLALDFGRTEQDSFTVAVPADYLVQKLEGANVRGWALRGVGVGQATRPAERHVDVTLLKAARGTESIVIVLHRQAALGQDAPATLDVPVISVVGAALHNGQLTIRRSPLLDLQTEQTVGVARTDAAPEVEALAAAAGEALESPLGIRPYQSYRFSATPFTVRLAAASAAAPPSANVRTVLRIAERQRSLESRIGVSPTGAPVYQVRVTVPDDLRVENVTAPGAFEWSDNKVDGRHVVAVYLATGQAQPFGVVISGVLGEPGTIQDVPLPRIEALDVAKQSGEIAVQVDPAFDVQAADLRNSQEVELQRVFSWLTPEQRPLARLALAYAAPDYGGTLRLTAREPQVACSTITNVRLSPTTIEETILLDFVVSKAGIRSVVFTVPGWMKDARITVPMLRERRIEPASNAPDAPLRVTLTLQDAVMGGLRVLVENDRLLTGETQLAPIPVVEIGHTDRRSVALENAGRDEVVVETLTGLEPLVRRQTEWQALAALLKGELTQAYIVTADQPQLAYKTKERVAVETAGARIGLAETVLVVDAHGTYRAAQSFRIDNTTEQFLDVELPAGASLWSALVAGTPVKPAQVPGAATPRSVRIPLIKTAPGDLDFGVVLYYGGRIDEPGVVQKIQFPLVRTVNVPVEMSQVRLYLPEDYRWFDFGGTAGQVTGEGELAAGYVRHQTKQIERLGWALENADQFAQVRASSNVGQLKERMYRFQSGSSVLADSKSLQAELASNEARLRWADEQQAKVIGQMTQQGQVGTPDNRATLNALFGQQQTTRSKNIVQDMDSNFAVTGEAERTGSQVGQQFDAGWLKGNDLVTTTPARDVGGKGDLTKTVTEPVGRVVMKKAGGQPPPPKVSEKTARTIEADKVITHEAVRQGGLDVGQRAAPRQQQQREDAAIVYQQRLLGAGRGAGGGERPATQPATAQPAGQGAFGPGSAPLVVSARMAQAEAAEQVYTWAAFGGAPAAGEPAGLASLAVEFPVRGTPYFFTTPRGEVTITARGISQASLGTLEHAGVVLLAVVLYALIRRAARRGRLVTLLGPTLLIVLGLASLVTGVLPLLGAAMVVAGVVIRISRGRRQRAVAGA